MGKGLIVMGCLRLKLAGVLQYLQMVALSSMFLKQA
jgi:hypothetical protein